jgi:hypothetical protein
MSTLLLLLLLCVAGFVILAQGLTQFLTARCICRDRLFAEIRVLKQLKHKNIMTFYDSWLDQKTYSVNFITEMFTSGTLRQ